MARRRLPLGLCRCMLLAAVLLLGCCPAALARESWAVYMYVCGSDLESDYGLATENLQELMKVSLPENVSFFIQTGGAKKWHLQGVPDREIGRYVYDSRGFSQLQKLPDADMGREETLAEFLAFAGEHFPADHRMLIFWDHGGGSLGGCCYDEKYEDVLSLGDIRQALESTMGQDPKTPPLELVCFDTCLMASLETANVFRGYSRYMVASQEIMPGTGTDYRAWAGALAENPGLDGRRLGKIICDSYMERCRAFDSEEMATLSLLELEKLPALNSAYEKLGQEALGEARRAPKEFFTGFDRAGNTVENYGTNRQEEESWTDMVDLGALAEETGLEAAAGVQESLGEVVAYRVAGPYRRYGHGLSCYYSLDGQGESLQSYRSLPGASPAFVSLYSRMLTTDAEGKVPYVFDLPALENREIELEGETAVLHLSPEEANAISQVDCLVTVHKDGRELILGTDDKLTKDWETGTFREAFQGEWPRLCGHVLPMDMEEAHPDYYIYSSLILLNGRRHYLLSVFDEEKKDFEILGAYRLLKNGQLDRFMKPLKKGDEVAPIFYDGEGREVQGEKFRLAKEPYIADEALPQGAYSFYFRLNAPRNEPVLTQGMEFQLEEQAKAA